MIIMLLDSNKRSFYDFFNCLEFFITCYNLCFLTMCLCVGVFDMCLCVPCVSMQACTQPQQVCASQWQPGLSILTVHLEIWSLVWALHRCHCLLLSHPPIANRSTASRDASYHNWLPSEDANSEPHT